MCLFSRTLSQKKMFLAFNKKISRNFGDKSFRTFWHLVRIFLAILETRVSAVLWNFTRHFQTILDARVFAVLQSLNHYIHFAVMSNQQLHGLLSMKFQRKFPKHDQRASTSAVISSSDWSTSLISTINQKDSKNFMESQTLYFERNNIYSQFINVNHCNLVYIALLGML